MPLKVRQRLDEGLEFYKGWLGGAKTVGAIAPSSKAMAKIMARVARPDSRLPVLELGPGTGVITKAILERGIAPGDLVSVECCADFLPGLKGRYPGVNFIHGDAENLSEIIEALGIAKFDTVISSLPLLSFPPQQRERLVELALDMLDPGRPLVQFSYGLGPPVPAQAHRIAVDHLDTVLLNLPPARIWAYRRLVEPG